MTPDHRQSNEETHHEIKTKEGKITLVGVMQTSDWSSVDTRVWQLSGYFQYKWFVGDLLSIRPTRPTVKQWKGYESVS